MVVYNQTFVTFSLLYLCLKLIFASVFVLNKDFIIIKELLFSSVYFREMIFFFLFCFAVHSISEYYSTTSLL